MPRILLIDEDHDHAERLRRELAARRLEVIHAADYGEAAGQLRKREPLYDLAVLCMTGPARPWVTVLRDLQSACLQAGLLDIPLFLCVSRAYLGVDLHLQIERTGARYVWEE